MSGYARAKLKIDLFKEEASERKRYREWLEEVQAWKDAWSLSQSKGSLWGLALGALVGMPAIGYGLGTAAGVAHKWKDRKAGAPKPIDLGGKFTTQGEIEAEAEMDKFGKGLDASMWAQIGKTLINVVQMGGGGELKSAFKTPAKDAAGNIAKSAPTTLGGKVKSWVNSTFGKAQPGDQKILSLNGVKTEAIFDGTNWVSTSSGEPIPVDLYPQPDTPFQIDWQNQ